TRPATGADYPRPRAGLPMRRHPLDPRCPHCPPRARRHSPLSGAHRLMLSLYYPTGSVIHRAPTWLKLVVLALGSIGLFWLPDSYWSALIIGAPLLGYLVARLPARVLGTDVFRMSWLVGFLLITQLIFNEPAQAITVVARLTTIILAAQLFTRTTKIQHLITTVEHLA